MPILPGRMPQMSVKNSTPGKSATPSGRKKRASAPTAEISTFASIIFALVNNGVPVTRLMASGAREISPHKIAAYHPIEIAMRNQRRDAAFLRPGDQDVGGLACAFCRGAGIFDFGMKTGVPEDAGDD